MIETSSNSAKKARVEAFSTILHVPSDKISKFLKNLLQDPRIDIANTLLQTTTIYSPQLKHQSHRLLMQAIFGCGTDRHGTGESQGSFGRRHWNYENNRQISPVLIVLKNYGRPSTALLAIVDGGQFGPMNIANTHPASASQRSIIAHASSLAASHCSSSDRNSAVRFAGLTRISTRTPSGRGVSL